MFWCAGMYASGSTWAYNVMRGIAGTRGPVRGRFVNTLADTNGLDDPALQHVVKSHDMPADVAARMRGLAKSIVVTIRDPRDAVTSLMLYQHYPFEMALTTIANSARFVGALTLHPGTLLLRYDTGFVDDPATIGRLAKALGIALRPGDLEDLFATSRRSQVETWIANLEQLPTAQRDARSGDIFDPETQWHRHHAGRTGEIGRWHRMLLPGQVTAVENALAEWMRQFGYAQAAPYTLNVGSISFKR